MSTACRCVDPVLQLLSEAWMEEAREAEKRGRLREWYMEEGRKILDLIDGLVKLYERKCREHTTQHR